MSETINQTLDLKCPKCCSSKVGAFVSEDQKGFKCLKCGERWAVMSLPKKIK